jgi:hypothetical protein
MGFYYPATKRELVELLEELHEYMSDRADVEDTESDVDHPQGVRSNEEMRFMAAIKYVLETYVEKLPEPYGDYPNRETKSEEGNDTMMNESIQKIKSQFKRFI